MKEFFKNTFPLDGRKLSLADSLKNYIKDGLYWPENPFSLYEMKHSLKNTFPLNGKTASPGKKTKEKYFPFKIGSPYFNNGLQQQKKKISTKAHCFQ